MVAILACVAALLSAHPIHTTMMELRWDQRSSEINILLHIFEDDLDSASTHARLSHGDYVLRNVKAIVAQREVPLTLCGETKIADGVFFCLQGSARDVRAIRVRNTLLTEWHADQTNIVRVEGVARSTKTLLLTARTPEGEAR